MRAITLFLTHLSRSERIDCDLNLAVDVPSVIFQGKLYLDAALYSSRAAGNTHFMNSGLLIYPYGAFKIEKSADAISRRRIS